MRKFEDPGKPTAVTTAILFVVLMVGLVVAMTGCAGGGLKASAVKPWSDQLAVAVPVLVDEALPLIEDPVKRARFEKYGKMAKAAAIGIKVVVDAATAAEKKEEGEPGEPGEPGMSRAMKVLFEPVP